MKTNRLQGKVASRISPDLSDWLERHAVQEHRPVSQIIRIAIEQYRKQIASGSSLHSLLTSSSEQAAEKSVA